MHCTLCDDIELLDDRVAMVIVRHEGGRADECELGTGFQQPRSEVGQSRLVAVSPPQIVQAKVVRDELPLSCRGHVESVMASTRDMKEPTFC